MKETKLLREAEDRIISTEDAHTNACVSTTAQVALRLRISLVRQAYFRRKRYAGSTLLARCTRVSDFAVFCLRSAGSSSFYVSARGNPSLSRHQSASEWLFG